MEEVMRLLPSKLSCMRRILSSSYVDKTEEVRGKTLYNMGTAYAEMERYQDAVKCFEQAISRGLSKDEQRTKDQIRRCNIHQEQKKKTGD